MYDGDTPLAERRAGALTLDRELLRELLGQEELRELLDPDALADLELSLQALTEERHATTLDGVHDLLRRLGDLGADEVAARTVGGAPVAGPWLAELAAARRAVRTRIAGDERWIAVEDVARYRDGVGIAPPVGVPAAFLGPTVAALDGLLSRWARTHGPFLTPEPARRWGLPVGVDRRRPRAARRRRHPPARGVPARWRRARVVRSGGPAPAPAALPGTAPARGRTGRSGRAGSIPAGLARDRARRRQPAAVSRYGRTRAPGRGRRPAGRSADPGVRAGTRRPAGTDPRVPAATPGRARRPRRGRLGGAGEPRPRRWPDRARPARARGPASQSDRSTAPSGPTDIGTTRSASTWPAAGPRSIATCSRLRVVAGTGRCSTRCGTWSGPARSPTTRSRRCGPCAGSEPAAATVRGGRPGQGVSPRSGHPRPPGAGRSFRRRPRRPRPSGSMPSAWPCSSATAIVTREAVAAEGIDGGFSAVYPVLRAMEDAGRIRRGYFVDGLGAAQFALAGALDRLRAVRDGADPPTGGADYLVAAADPANPYGAALPWPRRGEADRRPYQRAAGAYVVLVDGAAALYLDRGGSSLQVLPAGDDPDVALAAARALHGLVARRTTSRAGDPQGRWRRRGRLGVPSDPARCRLRGRLPRPRAPWRSPGERPVRAPVERRSSGSLNARGRHALPDRGRPAAVPRGADGRGGTGRGSRRGSPGPAHRRARDHGRRCPRQEPPDPLRQRAGDPDPPADERDAGIATGRASAGAGRRHGPDSSSRSRAPSRSASTRRSSSSSSSEPKRSIRRSRSSARTSWPQSSTPTRRSGACAIRCAPTRPWPRR